MPRHAILNHPASNADTGSAAPDRDVLDLVCRVGNDVAAALSSALDRVNALTATGRIGRGSLCALREEIERARRTGMLCQQIGRLASGCATPIDAPLDLTALVREALVQRSREIETRAIGLHQVLNAAQVYSDPTLSFGLVQGLLDWCFEHAHSRIDLIVENRSWPPCARIICAFAHAGSDDAEGATAPHTSLDTLSWQLLELTSNALCLKLDRHDTAERTLLTLAFPNTAQAATTADNLLVVDLTDKRDVALRGKPWAGSHVRGVAARREVRARVRDALRPLGLMLDFVASIDEAREFCAAGLPHAIVYEAQLGGARVQRLQAELVERAPGLVFIEIIEQGKAFEVAGQDGHEYCSVALDALTESLPSTLLFELAR